MDCDWRKVTYVETCGIHSLGDTTNIIMPSAWAKYGCRLPIVVKADFKKEGSAFVPKTAAVKFTSLDSQAVKRIEVGTWKLSANKQDLSFSLTFPKELVRRDVTLRGTVRCTGTVCSTASIRAMNEE